MPRGSDPKSKENLKKGTKFNAETAREAGKKSVQAREEKKQIKIYIQALFESEVGKDAKGKAISGAEALALAVFKAAMNGDWKAWELARDTAGQKPVDKVAVAQIDQKTASDVEKLVNRAMKKK